MSTLFVSDYGNDLQAAINAAAAGDTIVLDALTYGGVTIDKAITLFGANAGSAGTDPERGTESTILGQINVTAASGTVTLDGVRVENASSNTVQQYGINITGAADVKVENSIIHSDGPNGGTVSPFGDVGIFMGPAASGHMTIENNLIDGSGTTDDFSGAAWNRAIFAQSDATTLFILNNTITSARTGIGAQGVNTHDIIERNHITHATTGVAFSYGLSLGHVDHNTFDSVDTEYNLRGATSGVTFDASTNTHTNVEGTVQILGGDFNDTLTGTSGDDYIAGDASAAPADGSNYGVGSATDDSNILNGGAGNDTLLGSTGNDTLTGGTGNDTLKGGGGIDTATYSVPVTDKEVTYDSVNRTWIVNDGADGKDSLQHVERLTSTTDHAVLLVDPDGTGFATIQAAIDAAQAGDMIVVAAGIYNESVNVNKAGVTIIGQGEVNIHGTLAGENGVTGDLHTWLQTAPGYHSSATSTDGVNIAADNVTLTNINIDGFVYGVHFRVDTANTTLNDVNVAHSIVGIEKATQADINGLSVNGGTLSDGVIGVDFAKVPGPSGVGDGIASHVTIDGTAFTDYDEKGIYAETLTDSTITNVTMNNVGQYGGVPSNGANGRSGDGIDLNLKAGTYQNIVIENFHLTDTGASNGLGTSNVSGGAIVIEARSDPSYASAPGYYHGTVTVQNGTIDGITSTGIQVGEPGKNNAEPNVAVTNVTISGAQHADSFGDIGNETQSTLTVHGTTGVDTIVTSQTSTGAIVFDGGTGDDSFTGHGEVDSAVYSGPLTMSDITNDGTAWHVASGAEGTDTLKGVEQVSGSDGQHYLLVGGNGGYATLQAAVNAAHDNDIILVASGTYDEQVTVNGKSGLTIEAADGATVTIGAPADVTQTAISTSGRAINAVVTVLNGSNVQIENITIDGHGAGNTVDGASANFLGVYYGNASGGLTNVNVTGIHDAYPNVNDLTVDGFVIQSGNQRGVGVQVDNTSRLDFSMTGGSISDFQKNATVFNNANLDISGVHVTGGGAQTVNAQNGFQVSNSTGTIDGNTIDHIGYAGTQDVYSGAVLAYGNTDLHIDNNTIVGANDATPDAKVVGVFVTDFGTGNSGGSVDGNHISYVDEGVDVSGHMGPVAIEVLNNTIDHVDTTDQYQGGVEFYPDAGTINLDLVGTDQHDDLEGSAGNDLFDGKAGDDYISGGAGNDTVTEDAALAISSFHVVGGQWTVDGDGTDTVMGVEKVTDSNGHNFLLVGAGGYASIQAAVDAAVAGDTILVAGGTYTETAAQAPGGPSGLYINTANLTIQGFSSVTGDAVTSAAEAQTDGPTVIAGAETNFGANFWIDAGGTGASLSGLHLEAGPATDNKLVEVWADNTSLTNNFIDVYTPAPANAYTYAIAVYYNDNGSEASDTITSLNLSGNILNEGIYLANGVGDGTSGTISAAEVISGNTFEGTFDYNTGEGRYDTLASGGNVAGTAWLLESVQSPTFTGNTLGDNTTPFLLRGSDNSEANLPTAAQIAAYLVSNTTAGTSYAYALKADGSLDTAARNDGSGVYHSYAVTNTIDTMDLAFDATGDAVFGAAPRQYAHAGDTLVVQSVGTTNSSIMVDNLHIAETATSTDLNLTLASSLADGGAIAGGVHSITINDYASGLGANVDVTGNELDNTITGNSGDNSLSGGGGNDVLTGGAGHDSLDGGDGTDTAVYSATLSVASFSHSVAGATWTVAADGGEVLKHIEKVSDGSGHSYLLVGAGGFTSLQAAVDAAQAGDTILLSEGTFTGNATVDKALTILGANHGISATGTRVAETVIDGQITVTAASGNVVIDGLDVVNNSANTLQQDGIDINGGANVTVENTILHTTYGNANFTPTNSNGWGDVAIYINSAATGHILIDHNLIDGGGSGGFSGASWARGLQTNTDASVITITNNTVSGNRSGLNFEGLSANDTVSGNTLVANGTAMGFGTTINMSGVTGNILDGNYDDFNFRTAYNGITFSAATQTIANVGPDGYLKFLGSDFNDNLTGTEGNDFITADASTNSDGLNFGFGSPNVDSNTLNGLGGNDILYGSQGIDTLKGGNGNDVMDGGAGADKMYGGAGDDTYFVDTSGETVSEQTVAGVDDGGTDLVNSAVGFTLGTFLENLTLTGTAAVNGIGNELANVMTGNGAVNILKGMDGNDTLDGGVGADRLYGGAGNDTYIIDDTGDIASEAMTTPTSDDGGTDLVKSSVTYTIGSFIENLTLTGSAAINGTGNNLANAITGNSGDNILRGLGGNDILDGGAGNNTLYGGAGDDTYVVNSATDHVSEITSGTSDDGGTDLVMSSVGFSLATYVDNLTLTGAAAINGIGNDGGNVMTGNGAVNILKGMGGNDTLDGGAGGDKLYGGAGNDTYIIDDTGDIASEAMTIPTSDDGGTDLVKSSVTSTLGLFLENLTLTGSATINGTGNTQDNILTGNAGTNVLKGLGGNDWLDGGAGINNLFGGAGNDTYVINANTDHASETTLAGVDDGGVDTVLSAITYTLGSFIENLTLTGTTSVSGYGNELDNTLTGNGAVNNLKGMAGNDWINGGAGADNMAGGAGNDTYVVDDTHDVVSEQATTVGVDDGGTDLVQSSVTYGLGNFIENLTLTGSANVNATGNGLDNALVGNSGNNVLNGLAGRDTLTGGAGNDTFVLSGGHDFVTDFHESASPSDENDMIDLHATTHGTVDTSVISQDGADVLIDFGHGNLMTVQNTTYDSAFLNHIIW